MRAGYPLCCPGPVTVPAATLAVVVSRRGCVCARVVRRARARACVCVCLLLAVSRGGPKGLSLNGAEGLG